MNEAGQMYESDLTKFMREFLDRHPEELANRQKGRALWWDKPQDLESLRRAAESRVPQKAYYYEPD
jgi:hypothetical protein